MSAENLVLPAPLPGLRGRQVLLWLRRHGGSLALTVVLLYLVLAPLVRLQALAFGTGGEDTIAYGRALEHPNLVPVLLTTIGMALGSLVIALVLGTLLAWWASRLPPRLRFLGLLPVFPLVLPSVAYVAGWGLLLAPRSGSLNIWLRELPWWSHLDRGPIDGYSLPVIIVVTALGLTSFVYLFVQSGLANINHELVEAARVGGSSSAGAFFTVIVPLLRPTFVYGGAVALLLGLGQFTAPLLLGRAENINVLTTLVYQTIANAPADYGLAAAFASPLLIAGIALVLFQRVVLRNQNRFVTHGGRTVRPPQRGGIGAAVPLLVYGLLALGLPLLVIIFASLVQFWTGDFSASLSLDNYRELLGNRLAQRSITTSIVTSAIAVGIAIPLGFVIATLLRRTGTRGRGLRATVDFLAALPLGVPGVIFGAGFLYVYTQPPLVLYGTQWVLVIVYVTLMLPFTTRMQLSGMAALGSAYTEASLTCGASTVRTQLTIVVPLMRTAIAGAAALMFVLLTHEFSASLLVRSTRVQVMGTVLYDYWANGSLTLVATMAVVMSVITALGVALAMLAGGASALRQL